jgi:hypothetical protein
MFVEVISMMVARMPERKVWTVVIEAINPRRPHGQRAEASGSRCRTAPGASGFRSPLPIPKLPGAIDACDAAAIHVAAQVVGEQFLWCPLVGWGSAGVG